MWRDALSKQIYPRQIHFTYYIIQRVGKEAVLSAAGFGGCPISGWFWSRRHKLDCYSVQWHLFSCESKYLIIGMATLPPTYWHSSYFYGSPEAGGFEEHSAWTRIWKVRVGLCGWHHHHSIGRLRNRSYRHCFMGIRSGESSKDWSEVGEVADWHLER